MARPKVEVKLTQAIDKMGLNKSIVRSWLGFKSPTTLRERELDSEMYIMEVLNFCKGARCKLTDLVVNQEDIDRIEADLSIPNEHFIS